MNEFLTLWMHPHFMVANTCHLHSSTPILSPAMHMSLALLIISDAQF